MSVMVVNDDSFHSQVFRASQPVLVEFSKLGLNRPGERDLSAETGLIIDGLASDYEGRVKIIRVPMDESSKSTMENYGVESAPTVIFFKDDKPVERTADFHLKTWYKIRLDEMLNPTPADTGPETAKTRFESFIEEQINLVEQNISSAKSPGLAEVARAKLEFFLTMRRVLSGTSTLADLGLMDAVNDSLQALKLLDRNETFLTGIKQ